MKYLCLFALIASILSLQAQPVHFNSMHGLNIRNIGPAGMSGRVTSIDVNPTNDADIIIGTASGGVWRSRNEGISWTPIFDDMDTQSIGAVVFNPLNSNEIWVGTGEGNPRNSHNSGKGIYKSIDGGKTWTKMGLADTKTIHRILVHPQDKNTLFVGALGSAWGPNEDRGVFITRNGGQTWEKSLFINDQTGVADLILDPHNPDKLIAAMWEYGRKPWFFNSGGEGSGLHISYDSGKNWEKVKSDSGLPKEILGRMGLSFAPSKQDLVYALVEAKTNALYKSDDGGHTWKKVSDKNIGNRPFYYADIFVDPQNENRIFNLHSLVSKSDDGGRTFKNILPFDWFGGVHPDHHAFWIHPQNPKYLIEGNDGGLNISKDGGENWRFIENLPLAQFYHINIDDDIPYNVYGGMQDNGSWIGPSEIWKRGGIKNEDWQELYFGDGFDVVPQPKDNRFGYAMSQGGNVARYDRFTGDNKNIKPIHPEGVALRFNWNAGIAQDPFNTCGVFFGSQFVHRSRDCGKNWRIISPDLTTNDTAKQKQYLSGGLTIDFTHAENYTAILAIEPSPLDSNVIWVGTDDGNIQLTTNAGQTWDNLSNRLPGFRKGSWIPQIVASSHSTNEAFVVVNDYRRNHWEPALFHTTDLGKTWHQLVDKSDLDCHVWSIAQDPREEQLLFLGSDCGLYVSFDKGSHWMKWEKFPSTSVSDLKIHRRDGDLIVGTFGRAAWILDDLTPLRALARNNEAQFQLPFICFEPQAAYSASLRSVDGMRFIADGKFVGENATYGAVITTWISPDLFLNNDEKSDENDEEKETSNSDNKLKISVINNAGDTIRTFSRTADSCFFRFNWNLSMGGVRYPGHSKVNKEADVPSGAAALPGSYKVIVSYKGQVDSCNLEVLPDPRLPFELDKRSDNLERIQSLEETISAARLSFDNLKEMLSILDNVEASSRHLPDSTQKNIKKWNTDIRKEIKSLQELFTLPKDSKGIQRNPNNLNGHLSTAMNYLRSALSGSDAQDIAERRAKAKARSTLEKVNHFVTNGWTSHVDRIKKTDLSVFRKIEVVKVPEK